ncbi:MAG: hypothetical protein F6K25_28030 [Okeania sp. SIO2G4]|uniref:hypothetical protein n=1 Tax=unclassified Okeania TaxID=2634635 RepID=UPI0013B98605|nr:MULTISPECIES: hypothetical protein [unclassified Okeania]NEP38717.1 hypothetical protein [Okeania sp. SIO2H7]NEP75433.1 hypothetical protein [Okeania sp. SIO2G5]NEP96531.1 hypothetical protein [Okeania sp. SIO2F5]NEQ94290.1 hypothetical protein [Okeania sp. SIO2G4]
MNNKFLLAIISLYFGLSFTYPAMAFNNVTNIKTEQKSLDENQIILADRKERYRIRARQKEDEYRQRKRHEFHERIDRRIKHEMDKPHNRSLPKAEKERIIQEAHDDLDRRLDRRWNTLENYRERKRRDRYHRDYDYGRRRDRYDRDYDYGRRRDRYDRDYDFYKRNCDYYGNCNYFENRPRNIRLKYYPNRD